ncbi:hypothetical protein NP493_4951g00002 [Ridgeia piscesae]|uniref:Uncharacterized protein n=1 Tax=Ridgeia piscesae TaxID=27915 RepID=A0AAD9IX22_RIDPI|nr:hypothetical protein NP493_4951g00002 [Ridgeia piscesae]
MLLPFLRTEHVHRHHCPVEGALNLLGILWPLVWCYLQEEIQVFLFTCDRSCRVEHVECHVTEIGDEMDVALSPATPAVFTERFLFGELEQQMFEVVHSVGVARVTRACALLQVRVVPGPNTILSLTSQ